MSTASSQPAGYVTDNTDCNDNDLSINPGADDTCGDGIDQDCSGSDKICTISTATINIDGNFDDWNGIPVAIDRELLGACMVG